MDFINHVRTFTNACGFRTPNNVEWNEKEAKLCIELIREEFREVQEAFTNLERDQNTTTYSQLLSELVDLIWVSVKLAIVLGLPLPIAWLEIAKANMSKVRSDGTVIRNSAGKIMKPDGWQPADIKSIVRRNL